MRPRPSPFWSSIHHSDHRRRYRPSRVCLSTVCLWSLLPVIGQSISVGIERAGWVSSGVYRPSRFASSTPSLSPSESVSADRVQGEVEHRPVRQAVSICVRKSWIGLIRVDKAIGVPVSVPSERPSPSESAFNGSVSFRSIRPLALLSSVPSRRPSPSVSASPGSVSSASRCHRGSYLPPVGQTVAIGITSQGIGMAQTFNIVV